VVAVGAVGGRGVIAVGAVGGGGGAISSPRPVVPPLLNASCVPSPGLG
jgi:hypothetical protein